MRTAPLLPLLTALTWGCEAEQAPPASSSASSPPAVSPAPAALDSAEAAAPRASSAVPAAFATESEALPEPDLEPATLAEQRQAMLRRMLALGVIQPGTELELTRIMSRSKMLGQGNPELTKHPMTRSECLQRRRDAGVRERVETRCGAPFMAPVFDPETETAEQASLCVDRYEFPGLPCEYPVTWVTTQEAQDLCKAIGKRLCDAHEWEGACAGKLRPVAAEYAFGRPRSTMRGMHNLNRDIRWAYGDKKDHKKCGMKSGKSPECTSSGWKNCGSNTYPSGSFPSCRSPFGVYDLHGNAAEHMWLPLKPEQIGARGGFGIPEMKGSWFIFELHEAHVDDCRWRAPSWHENEGNNHSNYHLGFRCCKDVGASAISER